MAFKVFKPSGSRKRTKQFISITARQAFGLPRPFIDAQEVKEGVKAIILFDDQEMKVAIRFTTNTSLDFAYAVRISKNPAHGGMVVSKAFFEDNGIDAKKYSGHYDFIKTPMAELGFPNNEGHAYVIDLRQHAQSSNNEHEGALGGRNIDPSSEF